MYIETGLFCLFCGEKGLTKLKKSEDYPAQMAAAKLYGTLQGDYQPMDDFYCEYCNADFRTEYGTAESNN